MNKLIQNKIIKKKKNKFSLIKQQIQKRKSKTKLIMLNCQKKRKRKMRN